MSDHLSHYPFFQQLNPDTVVLTPNRRLSATLHKQYHLYQLEQQHQSWQTPRILPVISWIQQLWTDYTHSRIEASPLLLNAAQEQCIWEGILLNTKENEQLLQISETADLARSAWNLLKQWQVDLNHSAFQSSDDYAALALWIRKFQECCKNQNWIDTASLPEILITHIQSGGITPPSQLMMFGFSEYSPQLNQLLITCESHRSKIIHHPLSETQVEGQRINLLDQETEIQIMARWAKAILELNPLATIGCVVPSLDKIRDRVVQLFSEIFADDDTYTIDTQHCPFNISAGKSLANYPIINTALQLLSLHKPVVSSEILSYLLMTPFIGEAESERIKRANYDRLLRLNNKSTIKLSTVIQEEYNHSVSLSKNCPHLARRLRAFLALIAENQQQLTYTQWAKQFSALLTTLGWPGERSLSSEEYQMVESWLNLLTEFTTLDHIAKPVHLHEALHRLHKMASHRIFQAKSPETSIQVLGVLEAAGHPFDYVWVTGMDDLAWPPQPRPHPFIPKSLQRELHMPHATAERELTFCKMITNQFKQSASHLIFSHADQNEALELQPSPLIRDLCKINKDDLRLKSYIPPSQKIFNAKKIELIIDEKAPDVLIDEKIRGGISVIKQQALCPFKSFSEWRLHAHAIESPLPGLRAKDRGTVIHKSLEILWNELKDHTTLISLSDSELNNLIDQSVDIALCTVPNSHSEFIQYISLEKRRLNKLIWEWLQLEKKRSSFKISMNEKSVPFTLGQLPLTIKIDRIDELADGKRLIIDYKTGKQNEIHSWFSERPEEPQLPLYALVDTAQTCGISFAQIHPGEHLFKGVSHYALDIPGIKLISEIKKATAISWDEQLNQWHSILTQLSDDFYHGNAKVDPKDPPKTCAWCALKPLCRLNEDIT